MARTRIALFEGYGAPFRSMGRASPSLGRRAYYVPPREESLTDSRRPYRKGYKVKAKRNTPAMKRAQKKFKVCARKCATRRGARTKFPSCMRVCLKAKRKSKR